MVEGQHRDDWWHAGEASVDVREDGTFRVHAVQPLPEQALRLRIVAPGCEPIAPIPLVRGTKDLRVVLRAGVAFHARLLLPPWLQDLFDDDEVHALLKDATGTEHAIAGRPLDGAWLLASTSLAPGSYRLTIRVGVPLLVVDDIQLGGGNAPDPRLDPLDLHEAVQLLHVRARDHNGGFASVSGDVQLRDTKTGEWWGAGDLVMGVAFAAAPRRPIDVFLNVYEVGMAVQRAAMGVVDVMLPSPSEVVVHIDGVPKLREDVGLNATMEVAEDWATTHQLPSGTSPILGCYFDSKTNSIRVQLTGSATGEISLRNDEDDSEIVRIPCTLTQSTPELRVTLSAAERAAFEPLAAPK